MRMLNLLLSLLLISLSLVAAIRVSVDVSIDGSGSSSSSSGRSSVPAAGAELDSPILRDADKMSPHLGDFGMLMIQVDFPDAPANFTPSDFQSRYIESNFGVPAYCKKMSYGKMRFISDRSKAVGTGPITGPWPSALRLNRPRSYYANNFHGFDVASCPKCVAGVAMDALKILDQNWNGDFSPFTMPGSKTLDHVVVVFSGRVFQQGVAGADESRLLPTAVSMKRLMRRGFRSKKGFTADVVTFCEELHDDLDEVATARRCIHEFFHSLALPDLYDFDYRYTGGVGNFDSMSYGLYAFAKAPVPISSFPRAQMSWLEYRDINAFTQPQTLLLKPLNTAPDAIRIFKGNNDRSTEYWVFENHDSVSGDSFIWFCDGLHVFHVDESVAAYGSQFSTNLVNTISGARCTGSNCASHRGYTLVEADGKDELQTTNRNGNCDKAFTKRGVSAFAGAMAKAFDGSDSGIRVEIVRECEDGALMLSITGTGDAGRKPLFNESCPEVDPRVIEARRRVVLRSARRLIPSLSAVEHTRPVHDYIDYTRLIGNGRKIDKIKRKFRFPKVLRAPPKYYGPRAPIGPHTRATRRSQRSKNAKPQK